MTRCGRQKQSRDVAGSHQHPRPFLRIHDRGGRRRDLDMFALAGFSACPADAVPAVRERAGTILKAPGGHGAIRELVDRILGPGVPAP